jgi:sulfur carrier protein
MNIRLNGQIKSNAAPDIASLLIAEGYANKTVAVARNGTFVPRSQHAATLVQDGDEIEIVAPMQGG